MQNGPATFLAELKQKLSWVSVHFESENDTSVEKFKKIGMLVEAEADLLGRSVRKTVLESRFRVSLPIV